MEDLYNERIVEHFEACSMDTIQNALHMYESMKLIEI